MAQPYTPDQFADAAKESLTNHRKDLFERRGAAADARHDLETREKYRAKRIRGGQDGKVKPVGGRAIDGKGPAKVMGTSG